MNTKVLTILSRLYFARKTQMNRFEIETDVNLAYTSFQKGGKKAEKQIFSQMATEKWILSVRGKSKRKQATPEDCSTQ